MINEPSELERYLRACLFKIRDGNVSSNLSSFKLFLWRMLSGKSVCIPFPDGDLSKEFTPWLKQNIGKRFMDWDISVTKKDPEGPYHMLVTVRKGKGSMIPLILLRWG